MLYMKFAVPFVLWAWVLSSTYARYVVPQVASLYASLERLEEGRGNSALFPKVIVFSIKIVLTFVQMYVLSTWSAYSVLRTLRFVQSPDIKKWICYLLAFLICEGALGVVARREEYRGFLSIVHSAMAMGLFVIFAFNPSLMKDTYPWLIRAMGVDF
ncbi:hypothetical protein [Aminobacterium mobile]|uniref:hypothetical protein n=1 Tax=Aminobacterium mobile TaxID=81467 RepID=UPI00046669DF|nr:hypothetical protein [Aminobacterium mobile]